MTLLLPPLLLYARIRRVTLPFVSLLLLVFLAATACDSTGGDSSPATPDPQTPSAPTPSPPPPPPPPTPPDAPTGLRAVGQGATETHMFIDLDWNAVPDAALYRLEVDWDERCRFFPDRLLDIFAHEGFFQRDLYETEIDLEVLDTSHRALLANQNQDYCFRVRAENAAGAHSPWSDIIIGRTVDADANHTPSGFEMRTLESKASQGGFLKQVTWRPVAGAYGYVVQTDTRPVSRQPLYPAPLNYSPDSAGNYGSNRNEHGCIMEIRVCTLHDEEAALDAMRKSWSRNPDNRDELVGCSDWSEEQEFTVEIPGEDLPHFSCR